MGCLFTTVKEYSIVLGAVKSGSSEAPCATDTIPVSELITNLSAAPFWMR